MTSEVNDGPTRDFFKKHRFFGCEEKDVYFFQQGMMPAFSMDGKLLLAEKDSLALSPDGHGGSLRVRSIRAARWPTCAAAASSIFLISKSITH